MKITRRSLVLGSLLSIGGGVGAAHAGTDWELVTVTRGATWEVNQAKGALEQKGGVLEGVLKDTKDGQPDYKIRIELSGEHAKAHFWFVSENDEGTALAGTYTKAPGATATHCPEQIQLTNGHQYIGLARDACEGRAAPK